MATTFNYHEAFRLGHNYAQYIVNELHAQGIAAELPPLEFAKDEADRERFTKHEKDVITAAGVLEVKSSSRTFTGDPSAYQWPTLIVDTAYGFANKVRRPVAYVMVSQTTLDTVVVPVSSCEEWTRDVRYDKYRQLHDEFLIAPKRVLKSWWDLCNWLKARQ